MSFADWKKRSKKYQRYDSFRRDWTLAELCQAAYKAGERQGRNDAESICRQAILLRETLRANAELRPQAGQFPPVEP